MTMKCNYCNNGFYVGNRCDYCGNTYDRVFEENKKFFGIEEPVNDKGFEKASDIFKTSS